LSQNTLGRWCWNSKRVKNGKGIPWNIEVINTNRADFLWKNDHVHIIVRREGCYQIAFSFFNFSGEIVASLICSGKVMVTKKFKHKFFNSFSNFVVLEANSKIALSLATSTNEKYIEAFLSIRKL